MKAVILIKARNWQVGAEAMFPKITSLPGVVGACVTQGKMNLLVVVEGADDVEVTEVIRRVTAMEGVENSQVFSVVHGFEFSREVGVGV